LVSERGVKADTSTMSRFFRRIGVTFKKDHRRARAGGAPKGKRLVNKVPRGCWQIATFLAALRNDRIDAPCLFDGPIDGERFRAQVEQFLASTHKPGEIVILDNLGSQKGKAVRQAIRAAEVRLVFLPKYSSDLNPTGQVFAKLRSPWRRCGRAMAGAAGASSLLPSPDHCRDAAQRRGDLPTPRRPDGAQILTESGGPVFLLRSLGHDGAHLLLHPFDLLGLAGGPRLKISQLLAGARGGSFQGFRLVRAIAEPAPQRAQGQQPAPADSWKIESPRSRSVHLSLLQ
jgi:transposase